MARHRGNARFWRIGLTFATILAAALSRPAAASADVAYAVTQSNTLIRFDTRTPGTVTVIGPITTFPTAGIEILALDVRPVDGVLFGVGSDGVLYEMNPVTAKAFIRNPITTPPGVPFTGPIGADFDPMPGIDSLPHLPIWLLRVISDTDENAHMYESGTTRRDTPLSPASDVSAIAFSRNYVGTDRRTLFGIDHGSNSLVRIGDVDATDDGASVSQGAVHVIGPLGVDPAPDIGFDITAHDGAAYAAMGAAGDPQSTLYRINLQTGAATAVGVIAAGERVRGFALLARPVTIYLLTAAGEIVTLNSAIPGVPRRVVALSPSPETVLGIDARPATGDLYGLTSGGHLVTIDPTSGLMRQVATVSGASLVGVRFAIDFNPLTDRLHVVSDAGQHVSVDPDTGAATIQPLTGAAGVTSVAFTNNRADTASTTLLALNTTTDRLGRIDNLTTTGDFAAIGPIGVSAEPPSALDVSSVDDTIIAAISGPSATQTTLALIDPGTGAATSIGTVPDTIVVEDIAIASPGRVRFSRSTFYTPEYILGDDRPIVIERVGDVAEPVAVTLDRVGGGTAIQGVDHLGEYPVTVHFASGERTKTTRFIVLGDSLDEPDETINFALFAPQGGATLLAPSTAVMTIVDDDPTTGGGPSVLISAPTAGALFQATTRYVDLTGLVMLSGGSLREVRWVNDRGFSGTASFALEFSRWYFFVNQAPLLPGVNIITVTAEDEQGRTHSDTVVVTLDELKAVLAEGALGEFFETDLLLANPNADLAPVTIEYLRPGGGKVTKTGFLAPYSRQTITVNDVPELAGVGEVSMVVSADATRPVVVERTMRWGDGQYGAHTDKATDGPQTNWYFAEGSQGTFFTYILLANPNAFPINARVTFFVESPFNSPSPIYEVGLPPFSRHTVDAGSVPNVPNTSFGLKVEFRDGPGVAERAVYFGTAPLWVGGHESAGVSAPSMEWYLAEGATGSFFTTFVLLANPLPGMPAHVDVTFFPADGPPVQKPRFVLAPGKRLTLNVAEQDPSLADAAVATRVVSDWPIVVERAQYWPNPFPNWYEAHNSFGVTALGTRWGLAEGRVGGPEFYQTYILLANPGTTDADVTVTFLRESGAPLQHLITVPAGRRFNVQVDGRPDGLDLHDERFGALIESTQPIVVERAMYGNAAGQVWQTGTNAVGTRLPQ